MGYSFLRVIKGYSSGRSYRTKIMSVLIGPKNYMFLCVKKKDKDTNFVVSNLSLDINYGDIRIF